MSILKTAVKEGWFVMKIEVRDKNGKLIFKKNMSCKNAKKALDRLFKLMDSK